MKSQIEVRINDPVRAKFVSQTGNTCEPFLVITHMNPNRDPMVRFVATIRPEGMKAVQGLDTETKETLIGVDLVVSAAFIRDLAAKINAEYGPTLARDTN